MVYKNISNSDLLIPGIGRCKAGDTITTDKKIENVNFQDVTPATPESQQSNNTANQVQVNK